MLPEWDVEAHVRDGSVAQAIVRMAAEWDAELTAVGALGRSGLAQYLLGSVLAAVVSRAQCTVEIVRKRHIDAA